MASRDENVYLAKLVEQAERYEGMVEFMEKLANTAGEADELTIKERISNEKGRGNTGHGDAFRPYRDRIETEICG